MTYIKSIIIAAVVWFAIAFPLDELTSVSNEVGITLTTIVAIIAFLISVYILRSGHTVSTIASDSIGVIKGAKESIETNIDSKQAKYFYLAEQEYEAGKLDRGLWSQALVKAKGNENLRKVEYMKLRAKQLKRNENA
jgi:hypothetical protein